MRMQQEQIERGLAVFISTGCISLLIAIAAVTLPWEVNGMIITGAALAGIGSARKW